MLTVDATAARIIAAELGSVIADGQWSEPPPGTMRGVDFYSGMDLVRALIIGAHQFRAKHGYFPSLTRPKCFSEHIFLRKFFAPIRMPSLADKLAAYEYVKARIGNAFLPSVAWVGDDVNELWATDLEPGRFVLKSNNGCSFVMFLQLPNDLATKRGDIANTAAQWLDSRLVMRGANGTIAHSRRRYS
jgi:hypothetical protein